jgi:hypothetical protein
MQASVVSDFHDAFKNGTRSALNALTNSHRTWLTFASRENDQAYLLLFPIPADLPSLVVYGEAEWIPG